MIGAVEAQRAVGARVAPGAAVAGHDVLGDAPGARLVLDCRFGPPGGAPVRRVVAKCYADGTGARTAWVHDTLAVALGPAAPLALPRVLFYDADRRLLAQEHVRGVPYAELARGSRERAVAALHRAGAALAALHGCGPVLGPALGFDDHLRDLVPLHPLALAEREPRLAGRIDALLAALAADPRLRAGHAQAPVHRDLHLRQLLAAGDRVWLLDWDLAASADPALDLGNLIASMRTRLASTRADACAGALLAGHAAAGGARVAARVPAWEAFTHLRLACKRARIGAANWRAETETQLTLAAEALTR